MTTYIFTESNTSDVFYTSQFCEADAWKQLKKVLKDVDDWELTEEEEEDEDDE